MSEVDDSDEPWASSSPANRLATACYVCGLPSAKAAVTDGASANTSGWIRDLCDTYLPWQCGLLVLELW